MKKSLSTVLILSMFLLILTLLFSCSRENTVFKITHLKVAIDKKGMITSLKGISTNAQYHPKGQRTSLLTLYKDSVYYTPETANYDVQNTHITLQKEVSDLPPRKKGKRLFSSPTQLKLWVMQNRKLKMKVG